MRKYRHDSFADDPLTVEQRRALDAGQYSWFGSRFLLWLTIGFGLTLAFLIFEILAGNFN